jgi:hypothetical protein
MVACLLHCNLVARRRGGEGSTSFLKKRSKKLLQIAASRRSKGFNWVLPLTVKSFLVLFFKKELLS